MTWLRVHLYAGLLKEQLEREGQVEGLIGHIYASAGGGLTVETSEAVRGLAKLEAEERDRCVRFAKVAHDMGIADQQIALAEAQALAVVGVIFAAIDSVGLDGVLAARLRSEIAERIGALA
jgi:hypothetical protein